MCGDRWRYSEAGSSSSRAESSRHVEDPLRRRASSSREQGSSGSDSNSDIASQHGKREKTIEEFQEDYHTDIKQYGSLFDINTNVKDGTEKYENSIEINEGAIIGYNNKRSKINNKWHLSDIIYMQLRLVLQKANMDISEFDLKRWHGNLITNEQTRAVAIDILQGRQKATLERGSEDFNRLLNTTTQKSKQYLLSDHPEAFPGKQLLHMTIIQQCDAISINNEYG